MKLEDLITEANTLSPASPEAVASYHSSCDTIVAKVNQRMLARDDIETLVGRENLALMQDNHRNHVKFIGSILETPNAKILVETIIWVYKTYRARGFTPPYWSCQLQAWLQAIEEEVPAEHFIEIAKLYNWMLATVPDFKALSEESTLDTSPPPMPHA